MVKTLILNTLEETFNKLQIVVCGKHQWTFLEIICKTKINEGVPKIKNTLITKIPDLLRQSQSEFSKTGGIHASTLFNKEGKPL